MEINKLPVYNAVRALFKQFEESTKNKPINIKRGSIAWVEELLIETMDEISFANSAESEPKERMERINSARERLRKVQVRVRTLLDLHIIHQKGYDAIIREESKAMRQLNGWARSTLNNIEQ